VICPSCEFILDTSFLGDDILDGSTGSGVGEEDEEPTRVGAPMPPGMDVGRPEDADGFDDEEDNRTEASPFGGDALIFGDLGSNYESDPFEEPTGAVLQAAMSEEMSAVGPGGAPIYVDASTAALWAPEAVLGILPDVDPTKLALSPFEQHVIAFINGKRKVQRISEKSGLAEADLKIAITMLVEKKAVGLVRDEEEEQASAATTTDDRKARKNAPGVPGVPGVPGGNTPLAEALPTAKTPSLASAPSTEAAVDIPPVDDGPELPPQPKATSAARKGPRVPPAARAKAKEVYAKALKDITDGKMARAQQFARLAAKLDPSEPEYKKLLENWDQAKSVASASDDAPEDVRLFHQAIEAEKKKEYRTAVKLLRDAIKANPKNGQLHNRLGVVLATRLKDFTAAMSALFRAVELEPDNAAFRNNLGKVLARAEGKDAGSVNIDELLSGSGDFDAAKEMAKGPAKPKFGAFRRKRW
jgi:tetratricopeptide (TPR) repeat protein